MYLGEVRISRRNFKKPADGPPAINNEVDRLPQKVALPPIPPKYYNNYLTYNGPLLNKYKMTNVGVYSSKNPKSVFENIRPYIQGDLFTVVNVWKSPKFANARKIHEKLRKEYRETSGGYSGYTFHTITVDEIRGLHDCLFE